MRVEVVRVWEVLRCVRARIVEDVSKSMRYERTYVLNVKDPELETMPVAPELAEVDAAGTITVVSIVEVPEPRVIVLSMVV